MIDDSQESRSAPKEELVPIEVEELVQENDQEEEDEHVGAVEDEDEQEQENQENQDADGSKQSVTESTRSASLPQVNIGYIPESIKAMQAEEEKKQTMITSIFKKKDDDKKYTIEHILDCQSTDGFFHDNEGTKKILMSFLSKGDQWLYELWLNQREVNFRLLISYLAVAIIRNKYGWLAQELKMILKKTNIWIKRE